MRRPRAKLGFVLSVLGALFLIAMPGFGQAGGIDLPPGGTVRSLAADPAHPSTVLLGTTTGVVFRSLDAGAHWAFYSRVAPHHDWVVSSLVAAQGPPGAWFASLWSWDAPDGGVYRSRDDGRTWQPVLEHLAVRALAQAPSAPREWVAATLDGVYQSLDSGDHWQLISPPGDRELQNIESVAIDPRHPGEIYVGTWHLPWRTVNDGHDWWQMRQGVIDDSDVFSIAVDRALPSTVYLSACSGIYQSDDQGNQFRKIQGIPYAARRTPALVQDPAQPATLYAGTTQGLWATHDAGKTWAHLTSAQLRVNTVLVLPHRLLLGTDFAGVIASDDGGRTFHSSNPGFANRTVSAVVTGEGKRYLAVTGDGPWGGVFQQSPGTSRWTALPMLPGAQDAFALQASPSGLLAATAQGVYRLAQGSAPASAAATWSRPATAPRGPIAALASARPQADDVWAAGDAGLFASTNGGRHWSWLRASPAPLYRALAVPDDSGPDGVRGTWLFVAGNGYVVRSHDGGHHFLPGRLSLDSGPIHARINQLAAFPRDGTAALLTAATSRGLYLSNDWGAHWTLAGHGLPAGPMLSVHRAGDHLYALGAQVGEVFRSADYGQHWEPTTLPPARESLARSAPALPWIAPSPLPLGAASPPGPRPR